MDVLQVIKYDHEQIRATMRQILEATTITARKKLTDILSDQVTEHLYQESDYLYPEVQGMFNGSDDFVISALTSHKSVKKAVNEFAKLIAQKATKTVLDEKASKLQLALERHLADEEASLMPKIRELISTPEREDLGQVFLDLSQRGGLQHAPA